MGSSRTAARMGVGLVTATALAMACAPGQASSAPQAPSSRTVTDGRTSFVQVDNPAGPTLSYSPHSGVSLLQVRTTAGVLSFKDMNANQRLDAWEDWRNDVNTRAASLAGELTKEQIAGLMLFSSHERNAAAGLTDAQRKYLQQDQLRNVLNAGPNDVTANVTWVNEMQAFAEAQAAPGMPYVPVNFSSDPRSTAASDSAYNAAGADISRWPSNLGLAATVLAKARKK